MHEKSAESDQIGKMLLEITHLYIVARRLIFVPSLPTSLSCESKAPFSMLSSGNTRANPLTVRW